MSSSTASRGPSAATQLYDGGESATLRITHTAGLLHRGDAGASAARGRCRGGIDWRRADALKAERRARPATRAASVRRPGGTRLHLAPEPLRRFEADLVEALDDRLAYLCGLLVGDGCLTWRNRVILSSSDAAAVAAFRRAGRPPGPARLQRHASVRPDRRQQGPLSAAGTHRPVDWSRSHEAHSRARSSPHRNRSSPRSSRDCSTRTVPSIARDGTISYSTVSPTLAAQVQVVLFNFGIVASRGVKRGLVQGRAAPVSSV